MQAFPSKTYNQVTTINGLLQLSARNGMRQVIESDQGTHLAGHDMKQWSQDQDTLWILRLPYNPTGAGLINRMNGLLQQA